jgi:iron complex transport system substrate-binding protein
VSRRFTFALAAAVTAAALILGGCAAGTGAGTAGGTSSPGAGTAGFPVTITDAFGKTVIPRQPKRVVTLGWGSADAAIAMGIVPVAIPFQSYGGDKNGMLPWIAAALKKDGAKTPTILPNSEEPPYEAIAKAAPDVILTAYSGITKSQYDLLSKIAPVVGYPDAAWSTPWRDVITITGTALGRSAQATAVLAGIDAKIAAAKAANPEFAGKTIALASDSGGTFYVYKKADPRVAFTLDLGFSSAPSVDTLASGGSSFYYPLSYEQLDRLTSDVLVNFAATKADSTAFLASGYAQAMTQVQNGSVASPVGTAFAASVSPPTALSLTWGLNSYVTLLAKAARAADAAG